VTAGEAFIVAAVRTAGGRRGGRLRAGGRPRETQCQRRCDRPGSSLGRVGREIDGDSHLFYALKARGKRYGLQTMCEGGGLANVTIVEAL
jgi:acetyl-CoA C-acetyltransferase